MGTVRWHHRGISVTFPMFRPHRRNAELLGDLRRPHAFSFRLSHLSRIDRNQAPLVDASSLGLRDALHLPFFAQVGFDSAKTPSISRKHLPVAVPVSIGCFVAFRFLLRLRQG